MKPGGVIAEMEDMVDAAGVAPASPTSATNGAPSSADLDRVAEDQRAAAETNGEAKPETYLQCGVYVQAADDSPEQCSKPAIAKLSVILMGKPLLADLHMCDDHDKAAREGGLQVKRDVVSRIVRPDNLVVPGR